MNEKQNVCPCCGHVIKSTKWLYKEQWTDALRAEFKNCGWILSYFYSLEKGCDARPVGSPTCERRIIPLPESIKEWIASNPEPQMTCDEFIVTLAKRVEALEAALAEKGDPK